MWDLVEKKTGGREKIKEGGEEMREGRKEGKGVGFFKFNSRRWECRPLEFFKNQKPALGVPAIGIF